MAENSAIQWTDHTFNPWIGCAKVSPGCKNCYAETLMDTRYGRVEWGVHGTRVRTSPANWKKPRRWDRQAAEFGQRARVFCASLADVFEDRAELEPWRDDLLDLIYLTPNLDWQLLTKRPENVMEMVGHERMSVIADSLWIGTSVENQEYADLRIPELLRIPAAVRFLSCEPLLGPVDITRSDSIALAQAARDGFTISQVDWVIIGGESGPGARPCDIEWVRSLVQQCQAAGLPAFTKQVGSVLARELGSDDRKGGAMEDWPADIQVRRFPTHEEVARG